MLHALTMAGGGGTRFWPRSRRKNPKQFLTLVGERSMLQQALDRVEAAIPADRTWVVTAAEHQAEVARQLPHLPGGRIVGEPVGRDTAACIALGAALIEREDPEAIMVVMPADHIIEPMQEFRRALHVAEQMVQEHPEALVTFGIVPTYPATGYGYIHRGPVLAQRLGIAVHRVEGFREKPDIDLAERMVAAGEYFWNSGIFCWKAATILYALETNQPKLAAAARRIAASWDGPDGRRILEEEYDRLERISIDYAVMERAQEVLVVQAPFRWDDLGSWLALERLHPQDADGNTVLAAHAGIGTKNCLLVADPEVLVATVGVDNLLIVQNGDAVLVADRREEGTVKKLVELLKSKGLDRYL